MGQKQGEHIIPLVGARTAAQLRENLAAADVMLSDEQWSRLDAVSRIDPGFPHEFLQTDGVKQILYGNAADKLTTQESDSDMSGFRFSQFHAPDRSVFDQLFELFRELLVYTSGDVTEALDWLQPAGSAIPHYHRWNMVWAISSRN